jgi:hypothetical protein
MGFPLIKLEVKGMRKLFQAVKHLWHTMGVRKQDLPIIHL